MDIEDLNTSMEILTALEKIRDYGILYNSSITDCIKYLRNICTRGPSLQKAIVSFTDFIPTIERLINFLKGDDEKFLWQLIANLCVQNQETQNLIYNHLGEIIMSSSLEEKIDDITNIKLMILYNIHIGGGCIDLTDLKSFRFILRMWSEVLEKKSNHTLEFLHLFFEYFLVRKNSIVETYASLASIQKITALNYILFYIQNYSSNAIIQSVLLSYISEEFKINSDYIIKMDSSFVENINAVELLNSLRVIASASGSDVYHEVYSKDHSLFLNVGIILRSLNEIKDQEKLILSSMNKLEEVAPNSNISHDFEKEVSFELKTLLIRILANLSYKNLKNQEYAREMRFLTAILNCTQMDARNPLMKEWSIIAVRNLCDGSVENQNYIRNLTKLGDVSNDLLKELNFEMGSLRISK